MISARNILKVIVSFTIIYLLLTYNVVNVAELGLIFKNYEYILFALLLMIITVPLGTYRWWALLCSERYNISYKNTLLIYSTGLFFNIFMPGSSGGDITKGYYLFKQVEKDQRVIAIFTIAVDRVIGIHALLFLISIFGFILSGKIIPMREISELFFFILLIMIISVPLLILLINFSNLFIKFINKNNSNIISNILIRILKSLITYKKKKFLLLKCWIVSLISHLILLSCFYIISISYDAQLFSYFESTFVAGLSLISNAIPLTPGGIGIGESAFNYLSEFFVGNQNIAYGGIFFITIRVLFNLVCLTGAISFVLLKQPSDLYKKINQ